MANEATESKGMDTGTAVVSLVGNATSGAIVAASVACPPIGIAVALGIGILWLVGYNTPDDKK